MPLTVHFAWFVLCCECHLSGKKGKTMDWAGREVVERVLWAEKTVCAKTGWGCTALHTQRICCLGQTHARAQERSEVPRKSISWTPHGSASNPHQAFLLPIPELCQLPTLGGRVFPMGMSHARGPPATPSTEPPWQLPSLPLEPAPSPGDL